MADVYLYVHQAQPIFRARINMPGSLVYPLTELVFDGVTLGSFSGVVADMFMTVGSAVDLDDRGRQRVQKPATSTTIPIMRTSQGIEDGELDIRNNDFVTVWDDFRVHSKIPGFSDDGTIQYKDTNEPVGTHTTTPPPVANCGPGVAATINSGTSLITVQFSGTNSITIANGATITTYSWNVGDGTITVGTSASSTITATFPAGFRWVALTVTDSNGKSHTARCPVYARNPAADTTIKNFVAETTISHTGQTLQLQIFEDLPRTTYIDGTLVMLWEGEPATAADRSNMQFIGWHQVDEADVRAVRTGNERGTTLTCVDVAGRLASLPGFPQSLEKHATPNNWDKMVAPTMRKYIHYLIQWHSTAVSLADVFLPTYLEDDYPFVIFASEGESLYDQVENEAKAIVPAHHFTCNRLGQLSVVVDPMLQGSGDRTATVQAAFTEDYTTAIRFAHTRPPKVHWLRGHAIIASTDYTVVGLANQIMTVHCIVPGLAAGQGLNERETPEGITISQSTLNSAKGHEYARLNSRYGPISVTPADDDPYLLVEPANMTWVTLTVTAATAAQRGLTFATVRCLPKEIRRRWQTTRTGTVRRSEFALEVETNGVAAVTHVPEGAPPPAPFVPPAFGDPSLYYGNMAAYILWDGAHVVRTWNLQAASPVWELVDTGITGSILDGQYVMVDADTVGMWLMTSTAVWWCADIMAATPSWSAVLALATVVASEEVPSAGSVVLKSMFHYWSEPGYLIVATGPSPNNVWDYPHSYTWHTHDYGQTWTHVNMNEFFWDTGDGISGYHRAGTYSFNIFRSAPGTIYALRGTGRFGLQGRTAVFLSTDLGTTWTKGYEILGPGDDLDMAIINPFPNATDPAYFSRGNSGSAQLPRLYRSTDGWATGTLLTTPSGYDGIAARRRINKRTFDNTHIIAWWQLASGSDYDLLESFDQGATWSAPLLSQLEAQPYSTPNGWPPDVLQWVVVKPAGTLGTINALNIRLTLDNFATMLDKQGNLSSVLPGGTWTDGLGDGFALPKVSPNL